MRFLALFSTAVMMVAAASQPASAQRFSRSGLRSGSAVSNVRQPSRTVAPAVNRGRVTAKLQNSAGRVWTGQAAIAGGKFEFPNKIRGKVEFPNKIGGKIEFPNNIRGKVELLNKWGIQQFNTKDTLQTFRDRPQRSKIDAKIKDQILAKVRSSGQGPGNVRGGIVIIRPGLIFIARWSPWRQPYPYYVPIPPRPGPVPIYIEGNDSPVVVQSPVHDAETTPDNPPKPDLAIILAACPLQAVMAGQDLGPVLQVAAACLSTDRVDDVAIDVFLTTDPERVENGRQAKYSPQYSDGVLLKDGREVVSFPGNGLLNVPLKGAVTIPADTPSGDYYLGVAIDSGNTVEESDETNNIQFVPVRVTAMGQPAP